MMNLNADTRAVLVGWDFSYTGFYYILLDLPDSEELFHYVA
ncbi:hypothetical protein [Blautia massiliensis (ex Liu et al. 2021)]|nr:hypothetical protein [Bariatricus sp.]